MQMLTLKRWFSKTWVQWLTAALVFFIISCFYLGSAATSCNVASPAFNSDTSGGVAWFQWASGNGLSWTTTHKSNFPVGENLDRPQFVTAEAFDVVYRFFAVLTSPICGVNLMVLLAYMSSALTMFGLIKWLFKKQAIAYFAGFAAAFVPYYQFKSHSHVVYMFGSVFIGMVWAFLWFVKKPSYRRLAAFAGVTALGMYIDGYFVLIAVLLGGSLFASYVLRGSLPIVFKKGAISAELRYKKIWQNITKQYRWWLAFVAGLILLIIPIFAVQHMHSAEIHKSLSTARGNIQLEAKSYGARPVEFILPSINNPLLPVSYLNWRLSGIEQHGSNPSENTMYIGLVVAALAATALVLGFRATNKKLLLQQNITYSTLLYTVLVALVIVGSFSLAAHFTLNGRLLPAPFGLLIKHTTNWRVPSRLFLAVDPLFVILAAMGMFALTRNWATRKYLLFVTACGLLLFVEFLPFWPNHSGNLVTDTPQIYHQVARDSTVHTLAEFPILALQNVPSVFTFQQFHGKNVFNSNDSTIGEGPFNQSLAGPADAQTLGVLKRRGVDLVTDFGSDLSQVPGLTFYAAPDRSALKISMPIIYSYRISPDVARRQFVLVAQSGFDTATVDTQQLSHHVLSRPGILRIYTATAANAPTGNYLLAFDALPYNTEQANVVFRQGGKVVWSGAVSAANSHVEFSATNQDITIQVDRPIDITNLSVTPQ